MFRNLIGYSIGIILCLRIIQGSPISLAELNAELSEDTVRQTKSAEMRKYFNESADPCEDFYEFACGNYGKYHATTTSTNYFDKLILALYVKIKRELDRADPADNEDDIKVKNFHRSCLSAPALMDDYREKLKGLIREFGQMPVLEGDNWQESDFVWTKTVSEIIYKTGLPILFEIAVRPDFKDNSINRLTFSQPPFPLPDLSLYVDETMSGEREKYKTAMANNLQALGVAQGLAEQTAQELLDFETALAHGMRDKKLDLQLGEIYTVEPIEEVQHKYSPVWDTQQLIGGAMGFTPNELMVQNHYLENAFKVFENASRKVLGNYIFYKYVTYFFIKPQKIEIFCLTVTKRLFYENLMNLIYRKYFPEQTKEGVLFMWQELKSAFEKVLLSPRLKWMQEDTRNQAVEKLKAMKLEILTFEGNNFTAALSEVQLNDHDYVLNLKVMRALLGQRSRLRFKEPPKQELVTYSSPFNDITENAVKIPLAEIQPLYAWSSLYPYAYNFANLGFDIAHEIVHGFDDIGRTFDAQGNLLDWWDPLSEHEFRNRKACFVDQYKAYSFGGRALPEMQAQYENIADNGGVRLAYAAYLQWYEKNVGSQRTEHSETWPDLKYTNRQLFFISYAQLWCSATHPDYMAIKAAGDVHVPEKFRVIGPLSNFDEFSKEFNCPKGSGMNPLKKCAIY